MKPPSSVPMEITPEIAAKCSGPDQLSKFDRLVRNVLAVSRAQAEKIYHKGKHPKKDR